MTSCLGTPGSKQRRQRASYIPVAPTTTQVVRFHQALGMLGGIAAAHANGEGFGDGFSEAQQLRHRGKRAAEVILYRARR